MFCDVFCGSWGSFVGFHAKATLTCHKAVLAEPPPPKGVRALVSPNASQSGSQWILDAVMLCDAEVDIARKMYLGIEKWHALTLDFGHASWK